MAYPERAAAPADDELKRKLILRVLFAGLMIVLLLGVLAFLDYLGSRPEEPAPSGPVFTSPVPVPKKDVSQPVKPANPTASLPVAAPVAAAVPAPAEAATEAVTASPPAPPVVPASPAAPMPPAVMAQPALPRADTRTTAPMTPAARMAPRSPVPATLAEGTSAASVPSQTPPVQENSAPAALPPSAPPITPPAERVLPSPPRLLSGYAVQAGVFADAQHAEELRARLTLNGIPSTLEARVQVGPFKTREEALAAQEKLKSLGLDGVLLPPKGARR